MGDDISFCELRKKEVVNAADGTKLGHIVDMIISVENKKALGLVAPVKKGGFFSKEQNLFIPLECIIKIGEDVILIDMSSPGDRKDDDKHDDDCRGKCKLYD
ncbi:MAG: YlmC/YmxH family sporulation protein [Clostridia bacterium]|nr:YlmC/YmxH family sporulation protein [Clostridia bacterium]